MRWGGASFLFLLSRFVGWVEKVEKIEKG